MGVAGPDYKRAGTENVEFQFLSSVFLINETLRLQFCRLGWVQPLHRSTLHLSFTINPTLLPGPAFVPRLPRFFSSVPAAVADTLAVCTLQERVAQ